ncbi:hypothetical protein [Natronococcus occultus]|uniref:hypothetical protein n=1 Tax=Natronococcus occultus TaxID=29288 RepID=UPI0006775E8A|nr:hypothetical protein [Natronococcus occultus]
MVVARGTSRQPYSTVTGVQKGDRCGVRNGRRTFPAEDADRDRKNAVDGERPVASSWSVLASRP